MKKRRFGRTGHQSTVAILGAAALGERTPAEVDAVMEQVIAAGVNHIDVAPSYGQAEKRLGPWLARMRDSFFLGCKTMERTREGAAAEMRRSLERLQVDAFDLYQLHAITSMEELDQVTGPGGALEAIRDARAPGLTRFIGITSHGLDAPAVLLEALHRFDFDSVLFPVNFVLYANPAYRRDAVELLRQCRAREVGVMAIKSVARGPWGDRPKTYDTWYVPFDDIEHIQPAVNLALSQDVTGLCSVGDITILPLFLEACARFTPLSLAEQGVLVASANEYEPLFT
ncbi:MAG: aldo/keto reductase [Chloroflexi bacterium]|nr:aldo/keto reductase [Chloroflexota bacterium]MBU1750687.1 aldo/keto reductase [Chloroflexota bacterium]